MKINTNDNVYVRLTEAGKRALDKHYEDLASSLRPLIFTYHGPQMEPDGRYRFQLWDLMNIFGPSFYSGCDTPFVDNSIEFEPPKEKEEYEKPMSSPVIRNRSNYRPDGGC